MTPRFPGHFSIFGFVFFVLKCLSGIAKQWSLEKFAILTLKPRISVKILIYPTWAIENLWIQEKTPAYARKTVCTYAEARDGVKKLSRVGKRISDVNLAFRFGAKLPFQGLLSEKSRLMFLVLDKRSHFWSHSRSILVSPPQDWAKFWQVNSWIKAYATSNL